MSKFIPQVLKDAFAPEESGTKQYAKNVTFIGTRGSSKTTGLGCIDLVCEIESSDNPKFTYEIDERTSGGISQISTDLCMGVFPKATPRGRIYQADIHLHWKNGWQGNKSVIIPVAETAGEDIENLMGAYRGDLYQPNMPTYGDAENLNRMISASHGFILAIAVPRSTMPYPQKLDNEPSSLHRNPDLNAYRILNAILKYKNRTRGSKPAEGIAVLLTKYDMCAAWIEQNGMDLYDPYGAELYLKTYFRKTMGVLKNYGLDKVRFFPVHVQVEKTVDQDGRVTFHTWQEGSGNTGYKIKVDYTRNLPVFSEQSYRQLIGWIKETFTN